MSYLKKVNFAFFFIYFTLAGALLIFWTAKNVQSIEIYEAPKEEPVSLAPSSDSHVGQEPSFPVPSHWKRLPASGMRVGSFQVGDSAGNQADVSVILLGQEAGGLLGNVNRWLGQIGRNPLSDSELETVIEKIPSISNELTIVNLLGAPSTQEQAILAVIRPVGNQTAFFKMTGPTSVLETERVWLINLAAESHFE